MLNRFIHNLLIAAIILTSFPAQAGDTLRTISAGTAVSNGDLFLTRQGSDTSDKSVTGTNLKTFFYNANLSVFQSTTSAQLAALLSDETGTGLAVFATNPVFTTPNLGTPSAVNLTNGTALPLSGLATQTANTVVGNATGSTASPTALSMTSCSTAASAVKWTTSTGFGCNTSITAAAAPISGLTGAATGVLTWLATPSSANLAAALTDETGTGVAVFSNSPTLITAALGSSTATTQTPGDNSSKVATTGFVANAILGQDFKEAAKYATTGPLPSVVYNNGSSGVGATLTGVALGAINLDSSAPSVNDRALIKNQVSSFQNGIYTVTATGSGAAVFVLTRTADFNQSSQIDTGDSVFVSSGSTQSTTTWAYNAADNPVIGTDPITFAQTSGQGSFTAGNGIAITGTSIAIDTSVTVDKTTAQTLTNKTLTSPILTAPDLGTPTALVGTNISGTAAGLTAGTVTTNANLTGDVTSSGNATTLATVNSNVGSFTAANITVNAKGLITAAANGTGGGGGVINGQWFGDGSDGNVTVSSGITTLTRDMYYNNLTISGTGSIRTTGYRVFVYGTLDITAAPAGAITATGLNGNSASGSSAPTAQSAQPIGTVGSYANISNPGATGVAGGTASGANGGGSAGAATNRGGNQSAATSGGAGGTGSSGSGGSGSATRGATAFTDVNRVLNTQVFGVIPATGLLIQITGGQSGRANGSGGGDGTAGGGGGNGGNGGGVLALFANIINRGGSTAASCITARGGNGGDGGNAIAGNRGGGGGGDGGGGGYVLLVFNTLSGSTATNAIEVSGGNGGNGGNGLGTGTGGDAGASGGGGQIDVYNLGANTYSNTPIVSATTGTTHIGGAGASATTSTASRINL